MAPQRILSHVHLQGLHSHQDIQVSFLPGLNLIHGKNGSGKTTLLHAIANLLERDIQRFCHIRFHRFQFRFQPDLEIILEQLETDNSEVSLIIDGTSKGRVTLQQPLPDAAADELERLLRIRPVYLPAFRSILEAASEPDYRRARYIHAEQEYRSSEFDGIMRRETQSLSRLALSPVQMRDQAVETASKTLLCRSWFGEFVPHIRYPSLANVKRELRTEFDRATFEISHRNQEAFATVFTDVLRAVLTKQEAPTKESVTTLLERVSKHLQELAPAEKSEANRYKGIADLIEQAAPKFSPQESAVRSILAVYDSVLKERAGYEQEAFAQLRNYENSYNLFITPKALKLDLRTGPRMRQATPVVVLPNGKPASLNVLSSGERQVLTMLFCATHMSALDGIMLIDEPEISLHVDWQRIILTEIMKQSGGRQIIACTHAPEVAAEHRDVMIDLQPATWKPPTLFSEPDSVEDSSDSGE